MTIINKSSFSEIVVAQHDAKFMTQVEHQLNFIEIHIVNMMKELKQFTENSLSGMLL